MPRAIYTHDEAAIILEMFERVLDRFDITVPSPEDDDREADNKARLYGSVYADLLFEVEDSLINMLRNHTDATTVIEDVFSGCA